MKLYPVLHKSCPRSFLYYLMLTFTLTTLAANVDENLSLMIVSIDCNSEGDDIALHRVPFFPRGEQPTLLKEFQGRHNNASIE